MVEVGTVIPYSFFHGFLDRLEKGSSACLVLRNGWKTIVSQFNCGGKSLVGSVLANFLDHAHNYNVVDEFTTASFLTYHLSQNHGTYLEVTHLFL